MRYGRRRRVTPATLTTASLTTVAPVGLQLRGGGTQRADFRTRPPTRCALRPGRGQGAAHGGSAPRFFGRVAAVGLAMAVGAVVAGALASAAGRRLTGDEPIR